VPDRRLGVARSAMMDSAVSAAPVSDNYPLSDTAQLGLATGDPLVDQYLRAARAANTHRAYAADLADFQKWGGTLPSSPDRIARYLAWSAQTHRPSTLRRRLAALAAQHRDAGQADPTKHLVIQRLMQGVERHHGHQIRRIAPLLLADIVRIVDGLGDTPADRRDLAILLVGFFGALRRSELVSIRQDDVSISGPSVTLRIRRSKTDQTGVGRTLELQGRDDKLCPVKAIEAWLRIQGGSTFLFGSGDKQLSGRTVARIVKLRVAQLGLDPRNYSGHSLRAGFATSASLAGWNMALIASQTGHRSQKVLARYVRAGSGHVPALQP
jgi:integrase